MGPRGKAALGTSLGDSVAAQRPWAASPRPVQRSRDKSKQPHGCCSHHPPAWSPATGAGPGRAPSCPRHSSHGTEPRRLPAPPSYDSFHTNISQVLSNAGQPWRCLASPRTTSD